MALTLPGHSAPAVGFEVPLEMLAACHGRVQHQCETLLRLVAGGFLVIHGAGKIVDEGIECSQSQDLGSVNDRSVAFFGAGVFGESRGVDGYTMWSDLNHRMNRGG